MSIDDTVRNADNIVEGDEIELPSREELMDQIREMELDWKLLNVFLNRTADQYEWCDDYERRLGKYNEHFVVLKLEERNHETGNSGDGYCLSTEKLEALRDTVRKRVEAKVRQQATRVVPPVAYAGTPDPYAVQAGLYTVQASLYAREEMERGIPCNCPECREYRG